MKKLLFKFITYIGLFVILPILKLLGKKFYEKTDTSKTSLYYWFSFEIIAQCKYLNLNIKAYLK